MVNLCCDLFKILVKTFNTSTIDDIREVHGTSVNNKVRYRTCENGSGDTDEEYTYIEIKLR